MKSMHFKMCYPATILVAVLATLPVLPCDNGDFVKMQALNLKGDRVEVEIDSCIAPIVKALNDAGIGTYTSCCGHGGNGHIVLADRILIVTPRTNLAGVLRLYSKEFEHDAIIQDGKTRLKLGREL